MSPDNGGNDDKRIYTLREEKPAKAVVILGVPLIMGMLIMVLYNLTDTYFIGLTGNDYQMAAVNLAYPVMMVMMAVSNMTGTGAASLIARSLGAGKEKMAEKTLMQGFLMTVVNSLLITFLGLLFMKGLVRVLGAKDNTFLFTEGYLKILLIGSIAVMGNFTFGQFLRAEGSVKLSVVSMIAGTVANMILDPVFIFTLGLEVKGAALATVLGNGLGMGISLYFFASGKSLVKPVLRYLSPDFTILKEIFYVGVPATLETLMTSVAFVVNNNLAVSYGELTVAAVGIAQKILSLGNYIYQGFASGTQPIMGYNYGARNYDRMLDVLKAGISVVSTTELVLMGIYGLFAPELISLFTSSNEVIKTGSMVLRALMFTLPFVAAVSMSRMSFQAMGKPLHAFVITLVRQLVLYIPLLLVFNRLFGFRGMIWAQPFTEMIMMAVSVYLLVSMIIGLRKTQNREGA